MTTYYTDEHEWLSVEGDIATVGITSYAQEQLGDIVYVDLPTVGTTVATGKDAAVVESVKAASDVYAPATGEVLEINEALDAEPALANSDAEGQGWFFKMKLSDLSELDGLMDKEEYEKFIS